MSLTAQLELDMAFEGGLRPELAGLVAGYRTDPALYDELVDAKGEIRSHWHAMLEHLARLGPEETQRLFESADRHMRDAGVVHRVYDDPGGVDRPWPLSHLPLVLPADDWRALADGIAQRARLHEALLTDLYGEQAVVKEGLLPAALVAGNSEYLRPLQRVKPAGGRFLHLYAADVSRGPDGRWWVVSDRTQSPSGLGYAIENRIALSRAMPDVFKTLSVDRLAGFYQQFRSALAARTGASDPQIALLTPGPLNETYFEHAYLARCLGFVLVEGGDLIVHRDMVYVRTIEGPKRIHALVRRVDADYADPMELNAASKLGVAGLVSAVRAGNIVIANALGSGLCEAPGLSGYMPALSEHLLDEELLLPNLATWWCGDKRARKHVLDNLDDMAVLPAFGRTLRGQMNNDGVDGQSLPPSEKARIRQLIESRGIDFVGQEPVRLATTPVWEKGRLQPRPYAIRIFASRGPDGWNVMSGGLCRLSERTDARELSMQRGGRSADVWIMGDRPQEPVTTVQPQDDIEINRQTATLPSRAADNLFWLGRYLERADAALRLTRSLIGSGHDSGISDIEESASDRLIATLGLWDAVDPAGMSVNQAIESVVASRRVGALPAIMSNAYQTAAAIRDRVSPDAWRALTELKATFVTQLPQRQLTLRRSTDRPMDALYEDIPGRVDHGLRALAALAGFSHENMNRQSGWHFLDLGARVERALSVARFARMLGIGFGHHPETIGAETGSLSCLLDLSDAQLAYRSRYLSGPAQKPVLDLVLLDGSHPRSLAYQVEEIALHLAKIRRHAPRALIRAAEDELDALASLIATTRPALIDANWLFTVERMIMTISDAITQRYLAGSPAATGLVQA